VNHVKIIGQKYGSNSALGNFDRFPNPRTQGSPRTRFIGRVLGGYPWAVGTYNTVYLQAGIEERLKASQTNMKAAERYSP
jgi:hypothetical protein